VSNESSGIVTVVTPLAKMPVMLRGGSIIPRRERIRRSSELMHGDPFTLVVALDGSGEATGSLYVDDGKTYEHTKGKYHYVDFKYSKSILKSNVLGVDGWGVGAGGKGFGGRVERVIVVGYEGSFSKVVLESDGGKVGLEFTKRDGVVVVKDPGVLIGTVFSITFHE
jgi:alpha 1,3-glucosidase